jgi:hypothetical protein
MQDVTGQLEVSTGVCACIWCRAEGGMGAFSIGASTWMSSRMACIKFVDCPRLVLWKVSYIFDR